MIPLARDAVPLRWWRAVEVDDGGDITTSWEDTGVIVLVSTYSISSTVTQTEDGKVTESIVSLLFPLPPGCEPMAGDRLGPESGPTIHLRDVKVSPGQAECTGVRI